MDARPELYTIVYSDTNDYDETNLGVQVHIEYGLPTYSVTQRGITTNTGLIKEVDTAEKYGKLVDRLDTKYYVVKATTDTLYKYVTDILKNISWCTRVKISIYTKNCEIHIYRKYWKEKVLCEYRIK